MLRDRPASRKGESYSLPAILKKESIEGGLKMEQKEKALRFYDIQDSADQEFSEWEEKEIETLKEDFLKLNAEQRINKISTYLINETRLPNHNILNLLIQYSADYFYHKEFEKRHPEIKVYDNKVFNNKKLCNELFLLQEENYKSIQDEIKNIGILEYYGKIKNEVFPYNFNGNMRLLNFLYNEWNDLKDTSPAADEQSDKPQPEKKTLLVNKENNNTVNEDERHISLINEIIQNKEKSKHIYKLLKPMIDNKSIIESPGTDNEPYILTRADVRDNISLIWEELKSKKYSITILNFQQLFFFNGDTFNLESYRSNKNKRQ